MNPPPAKLPREPFPRGFRVYATLLGLTGIGAVGGPFVVKGWVSSDVASLSADVKVMQAEQRATNVTLSKIEASLIPALDWQAERERMEKAIRDMVRAEALKR